MSTRGHRSPTAARRRRWGGLGWALVAGALAGLVLAGARSAPADAAVPANQRLVVLLRNHLARATPGPGGRHVMTVRARSVLTHVRTSLPVLDAATSRGESWLRVRLPGRPNGHTGWIAASHTLPGATPWRLVVDLSARSVSVYRNGRVARRFRAVVGKPATPTPRGAFFVEEVVAISPRDTGGPFALATSAYSSVFQEFEGGPGQTAIHGTTGLSGRPGTAVSFGCVRVSPSAITWLARRVVAGTPLTVRK